MSVCRSLLVGSRCITTCPVRGISTSLACYKRSLGGSEPLRNVRAGVYKTTRRGDVWITYEEAQPPPKIGVTKAWKSWNSSSLEGEGRAPETVVDDNFIREFMKGTFPGVLASDVIVKRRHNIVLISCIMSCILRPMKYYFLVGYTEELLSCLLKCPVKLEIQTVGSVYDLKFRTI